MKSITETDPRRTTGARGEQAAADHLTAKGWRILTRNARWREGELDIVALADGVLVFVEVKTLVARNGKPPFSPLESIGHRKQQRIRMLSRRWMVDQLPRTRLDEDVGFSSIRFDAIAATVSPAGTVIDIDHVTDAF